MTEPNTTAVAAVVEYTPIKELLSASWVRVKLVWVKLLLLSLFIYVASFVGTLILTMVIVGGGVLSSFSNAQSQELNLMKAVTTMAPIAIVLVIVYVLVMMFVGLVAGAAMLLVVAKAEEKPSLGSVISQGMKLFVPMLLTSILVAFLTIGGFFLFFIPGLIIAIFMSFSTYEVVVGGQKYLQAMKNSATIIKQHFGAIFVRILVIIGISIGLGILSGILQGMFKDIGVMSGLIGFIYTVVEIAFSWLIVCYMYLIYKNVRDKTNFSKSTSLTWMWVVSIIGWIIGVFVIMAMGVALSTFIKSGLLNKAFNEGMNPTVNDYMDDQTKSLDDQMMQIDAESLIEQYGSELSEEEQQMMRDIINAQELETTN